MRTWNEKLYLDAMPGRKKPGRPRGDFGLWLREMAENRIKTVVCLAPEAQIAAESAEYAQWRGRHRGASGGEQFELIDIPVDDYHAPEPFVAARFWKAAGDVAERIHAGERVFVHCAAGIGRTGMFAVAVLMQIGYKYDKALDEIKVIGSYPETTAQREFVTRGTNAPDEK